MKRWSGQIFLIMLLAGLAGLTFLLQSSVEPDSPRNDGKRRHDPDAIAENFVVRRFDENGQLKYRLTAPYLVHFPDDDSSELKAPTLIAYRPNTVPVTISGKNAKVTAKGETVFIWDEVSITRPALADRPEMIARMPDLTVRPNADYAFTNSPVEITQGPSWIKGVGAHLDNNTSTLVLQSQVTGLYFRPRETP